LSQDSVALSCGAPQPIWLGDLRDSAQVMLARCAAVIMFGSMARGEATDESDVDVLVVRPSFVPFDDDDWEDALLDWTDCARTFTGRRIEVMDAEVDELPVLLSRPGPTVWRDIADQGVVLAGRGIAELAS
jgi:Nucleotidyltransferase domain